jgi:hypothetical protein
VFSDENRTDLEATFDRAEIPAYGVEKIKVVKLGESQRVHHHILAGRPNDALQLEIIAAAATVARLILACRKRRLI